MQKEKQDQLGKKKQKDDALQNQTEQAKELGRTEEGKRCCDQPIKITGKRSGKTIDCKKEKRQRTEKSDCMRL